MALATVVPFLILIVVAHWLHRANGEVARYRRGLHALIQKPNPSGYVFATCDNLLAGREHDHRKGG